MIGETPMGDGPGDNAGFDSVPDEELMLRTGRGDTDAFEALVKRHERRVVGYFHRLHWDRYRAEDQAQEVFIRLFTHARDYVPTARFTTYMYRIAHNYWVDDIRRAKKERGQISLDAHDEDGTSLRDLVMAGTEDPRDKARKEEVLDAVIAAVDTLPDEQKAVFVLSEVKEMRYADIAEMLGIPVGTVKSRMHGAIRRLRTRLADIAPRGARDS
jgi:RNA polymerase sigma-70 factor (ECF subfamily)